MEILCFNKETNCKILTPSIKFIKDRKRFEKSLFYCIQIIIGLLLLISNIVVGRQAFIVNFVFQFILVTVYEGTVKSCFESSSLIPICYILYIYTYIIYIFIYIYIYIYICIFFFYQNLVQFTY